TRRCAERNMLQNGYALVVFKTNALESYLTADLPQRNAITFISILSCHPLDLAYAIETGEGLRDLRADASNLNQWRGHQSGENHVHKKDAERHRAVEDGTPPDQTEDDLQ